MSFPFNLDLLALVGAALSTAVAMPFWRRWCRRAGTMDDPGHRKIHHEPIPLAGGLAVMTGMLVPLLTGMVLGLTDSHWTREILSKITGPGAAFSLQYGMGRRWLPLAGIALGAMGMLVLGLRDDRADLKPGAKFTGQALIALLVAACGVRITLFVPSVIFSYAITVLWILTLVNAFNFMDNMNGLCSGLGVIGAWYFGLFAAIHGDYLVGALAFLIVGALLGFLPYNFPKATAFLGDSGSHLVGYFMAVLAILPHFHTREHPDDLAVLTPLLVLLMPLGDLVSVVMIRWRLGKPFYVGDNNHLSHRLVRAGCTPARAVALIWLMAALSGALAFLL